MSLTRIDHVNIRCRDLARSRAFYVDALGLIDGDRPNIAFPGAWLWLGDRAIVHLSGGRTAEGTDTGSFDHVAFAATDLAAVRARLDKAGVEYREGGLPNMPVRQIFLKDPDGISIEINVAVQPASQ